MQFTSREANIPSGKMEYVTGGRGKALVCLHPGSGIRITPAAETLAETFTLYFPVMPGFDGTALIDTAAKMPDLARLVAELIDTVTPGRNDIAGHSFGGWIAIWLAVLRPDLVNQLVLQCPAGFGVEAAPDADAETVLKRYYAHPEKRGPEQKSAAAIQANRRLYAHYTGGTASDEDLISRLGEIEARTLILYGRKDGIIPEESPRLLAARIPSATLEYIDDAAHNIEIDQPGDYVRLVSRFLV